MKRIIIYTIPLLLFALLSCNKEDTMLETEGNIDPKTDLAKITITAYGAEYNNVSKTVIAGEDFKQVHWNVNEKIAVFYNQTLNMFTSNNATVSGVSDFSGTIEGITDPAQLEGKEVMGLYPYNPNAAIDASGVVTTTLPSYQVAVDDTFADNLFISMGKSTTDATKMYFYNVCSGVCFTVSHNDIKIVTLRGANDEMLAGDFSVKFATIEGQEIPQIQSIINGSSIITVEAPNGETFIPGKRYYIVALPQTLTSGLIIEGFREDGTVYETAINRSVILKRSVFARKTEFDAGKIAQDLYDYTLNVIPPVAFPYTGGAYTWEHPEPGKQGIIIESYKTLKSDATKKSPVAWKSQISTDDGTTWNDLTEDNKSTYDADWLTLGAYATTPNSVMPVSYGVIADIAEGGTIDIEKVHTVALKSGKHKSGIDNSTKANAIDLSMYDLFGDDIAQTTANCYIVNAPGWYKFPMVYGNAIKDGATNTNSFTSTAAQVQFYDGDDAVLINFVDHNASNITQPWVSNAHSGGAYDISKAELIWQDEPNLATDITVGNSGADDDYIYFYVGKETIHQGNAVIAAYTGSTVAWSWHIWVTDQDMTSIPVKNYQNVIYDFLPVNLGWSDMGMDAGYAAREANMRIVQSIGNKTVDCDIFQNGYYDKNESGNCTFYEWGRKDPFLPSTGENAGTNKTWYNSAGISSTTLELAELSSYAAARRGINAIKAFIQNPFVYNTYNAMDHKHFNLWNANENTRTPNDNIVVKTVYDPSPIGYCIAASNAFTGFTTTGNKSTSTSEINGVSFSKGWYFKTNLGDATIFIPSAGFRNSGAELSSVNYRGSYWTPIGGERHNAYHLTFVPTEVNQFYPTSRHYACPLRSVQEK